MIGRGVVALGFGFAVVLGLAVITTGALVTGVVLAIVSEYLFVGDVLLIMLDGDVSGNKSIIIGPDDG